MRLLVEHVEALCEALVVQAGHLLPRILFHLYSVLKLGRMEQHRVYFVSVLNKDLAFELCSESILTVC